MSATGQPTHMGYAQALLNIAQAEGVLSTVTSQMSAFTNAMTTSPELASALTDQFIPVERRQSVVQNLLGDKAHPVTTNLLAMIVGAGRAKDLHSIVSALQGAAASEEGKVAGEVRSASPLSADQQDRITAAVSKRLGKTVSLTFLVDPSVVGGVITKVGDTVIDGTVRRRIEQLKAAV
jgi:F-type H+-transporting ATPase subunit delta